MEDYFGDVGEINLRDNRLTWRISDIFSFPISVGCEISSALFSYGSSRYSIRIWPRGLKSLSKTQEWFGICLHKHGDSGLGDSVEFSMAMGGGNIKTCSVECTDYNNFREDRFMEWTDFYTLRNQIAPYGELTIVCMLPLENSRRYKENVNPTKPFNCPMNDPPIKYQSGDYSSPDPLWKKSSFNVKLSDQNSSYEAPGVNFGCPSTVNSFYSSSMFENSFDHILETTETETSDFKIPHGVPKPQSESESKNHANARFNAKNKPKKTSNSAKGTPSKKTSKPVCNCAKFPPNTSNFQKKSDGYKVATSKNELTDVENAGQKSTQHGKTSASADHCPKGHKMLMQIYKELYLEGKVFDSTIIMDGKEFKVLKGILMKRSPIFADLLTENDAGNTCKIICIDPFDACDKSVFHNFMIYVYSGEIEDFSHKNMFGLYSAARKFEMPELEEECRQFLETSLSIDTFVNVLRSVHKQSELADEVVIFFAKNMEAITDTDDWEEFTQEDPRRANQLYRKAIKNCYKKTLE